MKLAIACAAAVCVLGTGLAPAQAADESPKGWMEGGTANQDYLVQKDAAVFHGGKASVSLRSTAEKPAGFGNLMQTIQADDFLGKRVRLSVFLKADQIVGSAGLWMRVDPRGGGPALSFDNMQDRPIVGTSDWTKYEVVLDVPGNAGQIAFGVLLEGTGTVWLDDFQLEAVSKKIPVTDLASKQPRRPVNPGFEE
jgi:hypothetical protein